MDRKQFEEWFKTTLSYAIFEDSNVWKVDLYAFNEPTNSYLHSGVQAAFESYQHQQAKVEELQRRNQMLNDNIKEQGQKLVYQNEVIETQAEKLLGLRDEKAELQKQIDALEKSYFVLARIKSIASKNLLESILIKEVRQALKGEG
ncbi:TPA: hypothetical protein ACIFDR_003721 [Acinetobacter baumannii]